MATEVFVVLQGEQTEPAGVFSSENKARKWLNKNGYRRDGVIYFLKGEDKDEPTNQAWICREWVQ